MKPIVIGYIRQQPDPRDFTIDSEPVMKSFANLPKVLPASVDLRPTSIPVMNQGQLGSCTANALAAMAGHFYEQAGNGQNFQGSRLATYYWTRLAMGTVGYDSGATIRQTMKTYVTNGLAKEALWPYVISRYRIAPPSNVKVDAAKRKALAYVLIDTPGKPVSQIVTDIKTQLAGGNAMEFGTYVYNSIFSVGADGMVPKPIPGELPIGGHAMCLMGYDDSKQCFLVQNSWGTSWAMQGYCWLPYSYFMTGYNGRDARDVWTVTRASWSV